MPAVTPEELAALAEENAKLRDRLTKANETKAENENNLLAEYQATQLKAENARLQAQVARAEQAAKVSASKEGAGSVIEAAQAELEAAKAQAKAAAEVPKPTVTPKDEKEGKS